MASPQSLDVLEALEVQRKHAGELVDPHNVAA